MAGEVGDEAKDMSEVVGQSGQPEAVDGEVGGLSIMAAVELMASRTPSSELTRIKLMTSSGRCWRGKEGWGGTGRRV